MFPDTIFGTCQVCGANGGDQTVDLTDADASARDAVGNGVVLEKYKGKLMCPVCINEAKADATSLQDTKKHAASERFRDKAGFVNTVED